MSYRFTVRALRERIINLLSKRFQRILKYRLLFSYIHALFT